VNRSRELTALDGLLAEHKGAQSPFVAVVTGTPGVGTTAIGVTWAHQVSKMFEDGQLFASLADIRRGTGVAVSDILAGFLRALGFPNSEIPASLAERSALFRTTTARKRILVVIDDALQAAEVIPLVPNSPLAVVVVITHNDLEELVLDGADLVSVPRLAPESAYDLLAEMVGVQRIEDGSLWIDELVEMCDGLPLALRLCGASLIRDPQISLGALVESLRDRQQRRRIWGFTERRPALAVFDFAYHQLDARGSHTYRLLGLVSRPEISAQAAAALCSLSTDATTDALSQLVRAHLIERTGTQRYRIHGVVHLHAQSVAEHDEPVATRVSAIRSLVDWYRQQARNADFAIIPDRLRLGTGRFDPNASGMLPLDSPESALDWFEVERASLADTVRQAHSHGWFEDAWELCESLWLFYFNRKHYEDWLDTHQIAISAARACGNVAAEARMLQQSARAHLELGNFDKATEELDAALVLAQEAAIERLIASVHEFRGILELERGEYGLAIASLQQARAMFSDSKYRRGVMLQDLHIGRAYLYAGDLANAVIHLEQARDSVDKTNDLVTFTQIQIEVGNAYRLEHRLKLAVAALESAVAHSRELGLWHNEAAARELLGQTWLEGEDSASAVHELQLARALYVMLSDPRTDRVEAQLVELM
jgi:tetratricopeptide (TPR) repeat protein